MIMHVTPKELNQVQRTSLYKTGVLFPVTQILCFNLTNSNESYYFSVLHRSYNHFSGYTYSVKPLFCFVHKYFSCRP